MKTGVADAANHIDDSTRGQAFLTHVDKGIQVTESVVKLKGIDANYSFLLLKSNILLYNITNLVFPIYMYLFNTLHTFS